jgi:hypothetical protein
LLLSPSIAASVGSIVSAIFACACALGKQYAHVDGVTYMDVSSIFMHDGKLDRGLFYDPKETPPDPPLHPTAQAQAKIAETIEPTLAAMLGDKSKPDFQE